MRALSETMMADLRQPEGKLHPILARIHRDHTLMLSIRDGYCNVYYRGGNIARIREKKPGVYSAFFDRNYNKTGQFIPELAEMIIDQADANQWVQTFGNLKNTMDEFFTLHPKPEREFQQLAARENNSSSISNESEYFITDIEVTNAKLRARFDLIGVRWLASQRKDGRLARVVLMEMKYADQALGGTAGVLKHLTDLDAFISDPTAYQNLCQTIESQFQQLDQLGLFQYNHCTNGTTVQLDVQTRPEVIFILANHNPRSKKLSACLNDPAIEPFAHSPHFDLRFYVSRFAGYALHSDCMLTLEEFKGLI